MIPTILLNSFALLGFIVASWFLVYGVRQLHSKFFYKRWLPTPESNKINELETRVEFLLDQVENQKDRIKQQEESATQVMQLLLNKGR